MRRVNSTQRRVALAAAEGRLGQVARTLTIELPLQERAVVVTTSADGE